LKRATWGVKSHLEIRYEGEHDNGVFVLNRGFSLKAAQRAARIIKSE
jgi:hypothetical protein